MQISIIHKSELERTTRIDAEYYRSDFMSLIGILTERKTSKLTDLCKVSDGNHMSIARYFIDNSSGIPYFRGQDISGFFLENVTPIFIPEEIYHTPWMSRSHFQIDDILLTVVGTIGSIALVTEKIQKATGSCKIAILRPHRVDSKYLSAFLLSKYGQQQLKRSIRGAVQTGIILEDFDQFFVYEATTSFQNQIRAVISKAITVNRLSKQLYQQAEHLLLSELGLADWQPRQQSTFIRNFSEFLQADRLDAEYFQPKYYDILKSIHTNRYPSQPLSALIEPIKNGFDYREFCEQGSPYIRVADIKNGRIDIENAAKVIITQDDIKKDVRLKSGDVLFTRKGSFGNAAVVQPGQEEAIISSEIMLLRLNKAFETTILPEYLSLYFNSELGYQQVEQKVHGVGYYSISQADLGQVAILLPPVSFQQELVRNISESFTCEKQSKLLLDIAKRGVELAIEQDEQRAEAWMQAQIQAPGIEMDQED